MNSDVGEKKQFQDQKHISMLQVLLYTTFQIVDTCLILNSSCLVDG